MREIVLVKDNEFKVQTREDPVPTANQVRIRVKASGINFADIMARKGMYPDRPPLPCVVGYEVSGIVDAVGPEANQALLGKPVVAVTQFKGYADTVITKDFHCVLKPQKCSFVEAAKHRILSYGATHLV